jgi:hypothetical protein
MICIFVLVWAIEEYRRACLLSCSGLRGGELGEVDEWA